jgi:hypothetical protein
MEPATMTVIVVPDSRKAEPIPSPGFLRTVRQHLDRHRQITTRVHVIGPDYVRVNVQATVLLRRGMSVADIHQKILNVLDEFLNPLRGGPEGGGWPFGRPVYKSEVYQVLEKRVDEIDGVQRLSLSAQNPDKLKQGNIIILPQELVSSGTHQIDIISQAVFR